MSRALPLRWMYWLVLVLTALTGACTTIPPNAGTDPRDPFERYNRHMAAFNDDIDKAITKPVATAYVDYVPEPARSCVGNMLANILEAPYLINNILQGKPDAAGVNFCRAVINSTMGLLGCFDVATTLGLEKREEDFGQTLGVWGFGPGPYFVWPFLGPSSIRDTVGRLESLLRLDPVLYMSNVPLRNSIYGVRVVDLRASLLPADKMVEGAALDRYLFIRDAYLQRRQSLIYDGNPPPPPDPDAEGPGSDQPKPEAPR
jgi:phospholipid-binding lipoprotein MlaA